MSSLHASPLSRHAVLGRSWSLAWRWGFSVLAGLAAAAAVYGTAIDRLGSGAGESTALAGLMALDVLAAPVAIGLLAWRRRPAAAVTTVLLSAFSVLSLGAGVLAAVSFAASQPLRRVVGLGVAFTVVAMAAALVVPDPDVPLWAEALGVAVVYSLLVLVGLYVRSRRQLVASLVRQAESAEREQAAVGESARLGERARIAREMHDALGHRLSVIAMHAGALESRPDLSAEDTRTAAGVVRENAQEAMSELRQVLGVLNEASSTRAGSDVPTLADLGELVEAGIGEGVVPELRWETDAEAVPSTVSRHLFRIAQEALTNVRKHAPGQPTLVVVRAPGPDDIELVVRNALARAGTVPAGTVPTSTVQAGLHHGLAGLAERARLAGGTFSAEVEAQAFVVRAVLPCRP